MRRWAVWLVVLGLLLAGGAAGWRAYRLDEELGV
jgi:predicted negative regulator of RcsB-dependent stress response